MSILSFDPGAGTFEHRCEACGYVDTLTLHPDAGHVTINAEQTCMTTRVCPHCERNGHPSIECFVLHPPSWEAAEGLHPESLVGMELQGARGVKNVVSEHLDGYHLGAHAVRQKALIRQMQQHPHLAPHAPLRPDPPIVRGGRRQWDGQWRHDAPDEQ